MLRSTTAFLLAVCTLACSGDDTNTSSAADASADDGVATMGDSASTASNDAGTVSGGSGTASGTASGAADSTSGDATTAETSAGSTSDAGSSGAASTGDASTSDGSDSGGACGMLGQSCLTATCCGAAMCCSGTPIPDGEAVCYDECPDSDRNLKKDFAPIDRAAILNGVAQLPITEWSYKDDVPGVRHIGPMAQDFKAAFDVGASDRAIHKIDADGVALVAVQALVEELARTQARVAVLEARLARLEDAPRTADAPAATP